MLLPLVSTCRRAKVLTEAAFLTRLEGMASTRSATGREAAMVSAETTGEKPADDGHRRAGQAASVKLSDADIASLCQEEKKDLECRVSANESATFPTAANAPVPCPGPSGNS